MNLILKIDALTFFLISKNKGIGKREMFQLSQKAIEFIFASGRVKEELKTIFDTAIDKLDL